MRDLENLVRALRQELVPASMVEEFLPDRDVAPFARDLMTCDGVTLPLTGEGAEKARAALLECLDAWIFFDRLRG